MTTCPSCGFQITQCPECGYATTFFPRHGKRGEGAHYGNRISRLNRTHELALGILKEAGAVDYQHGLGLSQIWKIAWNKRESSGFVPTKQGISGRLSELAGLGMVKTQSHVQLVDSGSMQFRADKQPRWFLSPMGKAE